VAQLQSCQGLSNESTYTFMAEEAGAGVDAGFEGAGVLGAAVDAGFEGAEVEGFEGAEVEGFEGAEVEGVDGALGAGVDAEFEVEGAFPDR